MPIVSRGRPKIIKDEPKEKLVKGYDLESTPFLCPDCKTDLTIEGVSIAETARVYGIMYFDKNGEHEDYSQNNIDNREITEVYCRECDAQLDLGTEIWGKLPKKIERI